MIYSFDFTYGINFLTISSVGFIIFIFSALVFTCLYGSCWIPSCFKGTEVAYLKKHAIKPTTKTEDNFYLSEVSSSRDSLSSSAGSTLSIRSDSAISVLSEINANTLPISLHSPFISTHKVNGNNTDNSKPAVFVKLQYVNLNGQNGRLHVSIKNVTSLPPKEFPRYTEIYIILTAKCQKTTLKGRHENVLRIYQTKPFRNTRSTELDEHFVIEGKSVDMKYWKFHVSVYEEDLYTKPTELASASISLAEKAKLLLNDSGDWVNLICKLQPVINSVGNILVGLSYLPTSQRLSVSIIKLANLKTNIEFRPYVQLHLLAGVIGRSLKKKKLMFESTSDPLDLNANISFDVLPSNLTTITLLIVLFNRVRINKDEHTIKDEKANEMDEIEYVDECVGHLVLGNLVTGVKEKKHWTMMVSLPRRVVTVWHTLK